jgi:hypothetical protein
MRCPLARTQGFSRCRYTRYPGPRLTYACADLVLQATAPSKKEATIELADDDTAEPEDEMIVGIRFHVPNVREDVEEDEDNEEATLAEQLIAQIKESGDLETSGTAIAGFEVNIYYHRTLLLFT